MVSQRDRSSREQGASEAEALLEIADGGQVGVVPAEDAVKPAEPSQRRRAEAVGFKGVEAELAGLVHVTALESDEGEVDVRDGEALGPGAGSVLVFAAEEYLAGILGGAFWLAEPDVAGGGVERELRRVKDEAVLGMLGQRQARQGRGTGAHRVLGRAGVAQACPRLGLLHGELHAGERVLTKLEARAGALDRVVKRSSTSANHDSSS